MFHGCLVFNIFLFKFSQNLGHIRRQPFDTFLFQVVGNAVVCFGNSSGYAGQRVAVTAEGYSRADHVLKTVSLKKSRYRLGNRLLTGFNMAVGRTYIIAGAAQVISEFIDDEVAYLVFALSVSCEENRACSRLGSLDSLGMVSSKVSKSQPAADTRIAEPLP